MILILGTLLQPATSNGARRVVGIPNKMTFWQHGHS